MKFYGKSIITACAALSALPLFQSCLDKGDGYIDNSYLYPNAVVTVKPVTEGENKYFYFQLDDETKLWPLDNAVFPYDAFVSHVLRLLFDDHETEPVQYPLLGIPSGDALWFACPKLVVFVIQLHHGDGDIPGNRVVNDERDYNSSITQNARRFNFGPVCLFADFVSCICDVVPEMRPERR